MGPTPVDFWVPAGAKTVLAVALGGVVNPRDVYVGAEGRPLAPSGWVVNSSDLGELPAIVPGEEAGLLVGRSATDGNTQLRWRGGGLARQGGFSVIAGRRLDGLRLVSREASDAVQVGQYGVTWWGSVSTGTDGVDAIVPASTLLAIAYEEDGLFRYDNVTSGGTGLGVPNAYRLPRAEPYDRPAYDGTAEAGLFLWRDRGANGWWHLRGTAGGASARYKGRITADVPFSGIVPVNVEKTDLVRVVEGREIEFDLFMVGGLEDGIDFSVPSSGGAVLELLVPTEPGAVRIGARRYPVGRVPLRLGGW